MYHFTSCICFGLIARRTSSDKKKNVCFIHSRRHNYFWQWDKTCVKVFRLNKWNPGCMQNVPSDHKFSLAVEAEQVSPDGPAVFPCLIPGLLVWSRACEKLPKCKDYVGQIYKQKPWHVVVAQRFYPIWSYLVTSYPCTWWPLLLMAII